MLKLDGRRGKPAYLLRLAACRLRTNPSCISNQRTYNVCIIEFEWNRTKAETNLRKHGVSLDEAQSVFLDECALQFFDHEQSAEEDRFIMLGLSNMARILVVCHCERAQGRKLRIISARRATARERRFYEEPKT